MKELTDSGSITPVELKDISHTFGDLPYGVIPFSHVESRLLRVSSALRLPENSASVICVLFPYYLGEEYYKDLNISRYAVSRDYHEICGELLNALVRTLEEMYPENSFVPFTDNSPIPEVSAAVACGLGVEGKNSLLINEKYGSWVFIGEIVTDLRMAYSVHAHKSCDDCGKCIEACPSGALGESFNKEKCISFITQKKGELTDEQAMLIRKNSCAWGCDICQTVCPHNKNAAKSPVPEFYADIVSCVTDFYPAFGRAWAWRGEAVIKRNLGLIREQITQEG